MSDPTIRWYDENDPDDYAGVVELIAKHEYRLPESPEELAGIALIAHDEDGAVVGFIWSLSAEGSPVAYVDHLVIEKKYRARGLGIKMILVLRRLLQMRGVSTILALIPPGQGSYLKMLRSKLKATLLPNHAVMVVHPQPEPAAEEV
jgi:GNAT superfamily N-acetyltransferase